MSIQGVDQRSNTWVYLVSYRQNNGGLPPCCRLYTLLYLFTQKPMMRLLMSPRLRVPVLLGAFPTHMKGSEITPSESSPRPPELHHLMGHIKLYQSLPHPHKNYSATTWKVSYRSYFQTLSLKPFSSFPYPRHEIKTCIFFPLCSLAFKISLDFQNPHSTSSLNFSFFAPSSESLFMNSHKPVLLFISWATVVILI